MLDALMILPGMQGKSYGRLLLADSIKDLRIRYPGLEQLFVTSSDDAIVFYLKQGFVERCFGPNRLMKVLA